MPQSISARILVFGLDADLELTRKLLLNHAGYVVDAVQDWAGYEGLLMSDGSHYRLVVLCHTLLEEDRKASATLARERNIEVLELTGPFPPEEFLRRVSELAAV
jgi:DNA-binding response OmpR family regulator